MPPFDSVTADRVRNDLFILEKDIGLIEEGGITNCRVIKTGYLYPIVVYPGLPFNHREGELVSVKVFDNHTLRKLIFSNTFNSHELKSLGCGTL